VCAAVEGKLVKYDRRKWNEGHRRCHRVWACMQYGVKENNDFSESGEDGMILY
jgi:hypothetical protein